MKVAVGKAHDIRLFTDKKNNSPIIAVQNRIDRTDANVFSSGSAVKQMDSLQQQSQELRIRPYDRGKQAHCLRTE
jgi:hypothetical protein